MKKFDLVFEKAMFSLKETEEIRPDPTFEQNIKSLVSVLIDNDLIDDLNNRTVEDYINQEVETQENNVKQLTLGAENKTVPTIILKMSQIDQDGEGGTSSFKVTVDNETNKTPTKTFGPLEDITSIIDQVMTYVTMETTKNLSPDTAVNELPQEQGAQAQPGAEQSALPQGQ